MNGKLIVLEGIDGAGTTLQTRLLTKSLRIEYPNKHFFNTKEPSAGAIGSLTRYYLKNFRHMDLDPYARMLLFAADHIEHMQTVVGPLLNSGSNVIMDRFTPFSAYAYQIRKNPEEVVADLYLNISKFCKHELVPDLTIVLDCDLSVAKDRRMARDETQDYYDDDETQQVAQHIYRQFALEPDLAIMVNSNCGVEEVQMNVFNLVKGLFEDDSC